MRVMLASHQRLLYAVIGILCIAGGVFLMWDFFLQFAKFVVGLILFFAGLGFLFKRFKTRVFVAR